MSSEGSDPRTLARNFLTFQKELGVDLVPRPSQGMTSNTPVDEDPLEERAETSPEPVENHNLESLAGVAASCELCGLCEGRNHVVFGSGNPEADVMFVGEAPGREEDLQGLPFVGAAGELLTKMIAGIKLQRQDVYIANVIKCRPPGNRDPLPEEIQACESYLLKQIELIQPKVICSLGRFASQTLLNSTTSMGRLRGKVYDYRGIKLIPTYHPAALLRNPQWKRPTWEDLKLLRFEFDGTEL